MGPRILQLVDNRALKVVVSNDFSTPGVVWGPLVRLCLVSRVYLHLPDLIRAMLLISVLWGFVCVCVCMCFCTEISEHFRKADL